MTNKQTYQTTRRLSTTQIVIGGLLIALAFAVSFLPSLKTPYFQMGWGFIVTSFMGSIGGPVGGMIMAALSDVLKATLNPSGPFFAGYTLSAALAGIVYGVGLYGKKSTLPRVAITVLIITLFINIGLGTLWISMMNGKAFMVLIGPRVMKNIVSFFVNTAVLYMILNNGRVQSLIAKYRFPSFFNK